MNMQPTDIDLTSLFNKGVKEQNTGNLDNASKHVHQLIKTNKNISDFKGTNPDN